MSDAPLIEAVGLHTYYGASHVLHGIDLTLRRGETVALLGRNGMGKTTLLRSLLGLTPARRGEIRIEGIPMIGARADRIARAGIAYVPEGRGIFPTLSVRENMVLAARPGAWDLDRVLAVFPRLAQRLNHGGGQISGGEQQMLAIGRALVMNPKAILLDEITEGLAPLVAREIWSIISLIRQSGIAAIIVDRNLAQISGIAERLLIMVNGRLVLSGTPAELKTHSDLRRYLSL